MNTTGLILNREEHNSPRREPTIKKHVPITGIIVINDGCSIESLYERNENNINATPVAVINSPVFFLLYVLQSTSTTHPQLIPMLLFATYKTHN